MIRLCLVFTLLSCSAMYAQTGPGGVGSANGSSTLRGWWRADKGITITSGVLSGWADQSGSGNNLQQTPPALSPVTAISTALNNQAVIQFDGTSNRYFTGFSGPNVDNVTFFIAANGSNYHSLLLFTGGAGLVGYPWTSAGPKFITSNDGFVAGGVNAGFVNNANNIGAARYRRNTVNGMQTFLNGAVFAQKNSANLRLPNANILLVGSSAPGAFTAADVGELIIFYSALNDAQMVLVNNYLSARYNSPLSGSDVYTMDDPVNGNYDYDVAGIGQIDVANVHNDSQGTGIVRMLNPSDLEDGEFFMWGSDKGDLQVTNTTDVPSGVTARLARVWRVSETGGDGDVGSIDVQLDVTGLSDFNNLVTCEAALSLRLLVDTDNDGVFSDQTAISGATSLGNNVYRFANVTALANNSRFTFGLASHAPNGPGGVGKTGPTGSLQLWLMANKGVTTSGLAVTAWADQSGTDRISTPPTVNARPAYVASGLNGLPHIAFDGNSDFLELNSNISTTTPAMFAVIRRFATGLNFVGLLNLQNNLWITRAPGIDQWGMLNNTPVLSGSTLNIGAANIIGSVQRNFNDIDFYTDGSFSAGTNGTSFFGSSIGSVGARNLGSPNTGVAFFQGSISELIVFTTNLNDAQCLIIMNSLAAKYGGSLALARDVYKMDDPAKGNFDFDVAGIARVITGHQHTDAMGESIVRVFGATDLGDSESFFWGHNNVLISSGSTDVPPGVQSRMAREWGVSETGEVGAVNMQFDLSSLAGTITSSDLRLLIDHDGDGIYNEAGTHVISGATAATCGNYTFFGVSALNNSMRFTIGTVNASQTPLPIELVRFEGESLATSVRLLWETESELNNDFFTLERSATGTDFTEIAIVRGAGTSNGHHNYEFIDHVTFTGTLYYRLKQTDFDGKNSYSHIIRVKNQPGESVLVYPNPLHAGDAIHIELAEGYSSLGQSKIVLYDVFGREVFSYSGELNSSQITISIADTLSAGVYVLKINFPGGNSITRRIIVSD